MSNFPYVIDLHYGADHPETQLDFNPYQYLPFLKIFEKKENGWKWNGNNLFIKDEVGVGKTIEAGIVLYQFWKNYIKQNKIDPDNTDDLSVLFISPVKLRSNWIDEMSKFFGLQIDKDGICGQVMHLSYSDFIDRSNSTKTDKSNKTEDELSLEEEEAEDSTGNAFIPKCIEGVQFDIIIVDEAHRLRNESSCFHRGMLRLLAENHIKGGGPVVFLTGTPVVNGIDDYNNLITILKSDGAVFAETASTQAEAYAMTIAPEINMIPIDLGDIEKPIIETANDIGGCAPRIAASSPTALLDMLNNRVARLNKKLKTNNYNINNAPATSEYGDKFNENQFKTKEEIEAYISQTKGYIKQISDIVDKSGFETEKQKTLRELIENGDKDSKYIIFSCYIKTCEEIKKSLESVCFVECLTGSTTRENTDDAIRRFKSGDVRVLVCSDALSEGHNLQFCSNIIHYDLPFTPARVSQRNGRIYRHGQEKQPHITFLSVKGTYDERLYTDIFLGKMEQAEELTKRKAIVPMIGLPDIKTLTKEMYQTPDKECHEKLTELLKGLMKDGALLVNDDMVDNYARFIEYHEVWDSLKKKITPKDNVSEKEKESNEESVNNTLTSIAESLNNQQKEEREKFIYDNRVNYMNTAIKVGTDLGIPNLPQPINVTGSNQITDEEFDAFKASLKNSIKQLENIIGQWQTED